MSAPLKWYAFCVVRPSTKAALPRPTRLRAAVSVFRRTHQGRARQVWGLFVVFAAVLEGGNVWQNALRRRLDGPQEPCSVVSRVLVVLRVQYSAALSPAYTQTKAMRVSFTQALFSAVSPPEKPSSKAATSARWTTRTLLGREQGPCGPSGSIFCGIEPRTHPNKSHAGFPFTRALFSAVSPSKESADHPFILPFI